MGKKPKRMSASESVASAQTQAAEEFDDLPMSFESPESSLILGASYDPRTELITLDFKTGRYRGGLPRDQWKEFLEADSKGVYFNRRIRPFWDGVKI